MAKLFQHPGDEKYLVVSGQAEQNADEQDGQKAHHRARVRDAEQAPEMSVLKDADHQSHGGGGAKARAPRAGARHRRVAPPPPASGERRASCELSGQGLYEAGSFDVGHEPPPWDWWSA